MLLSRYAAKTPPTSILLERINFHHLKISEIITLYAKKSLAIQTKIILLEPVLRTTYQMHI